MASENVHGYDVDFVSEVWDELKCIICHMVLRIPLQHMNCGHRFCSPCFNEMKKYAEKLNSKLICPVDREDIDLAMVFEDKGIHRSIRALEVKCKQHGDGCSWVGCLSDLDEHLGRCQHQRKQAPVQPNNTLGVVNDQIYKQLLERIVKCEDVSVAKEKEIASLRFSVKEMKEEMKTMKELNKELKDEIVSLQQTDTKFKKEYQGELKSLHDINNKKLENKIKHNVGQRDNVLSGKETKDVEDSKQYVNDRVTSLEKKIQNLEKMMTQKALAATVAEVCSEINKVDEEVKSLRSHIDKTENSTTDEIKELRTHTRNIENVLFLYDSIVQKKVQFKWVLENFKHHFDKGEDISSPVFFSQLSGLRFQLNVLWSGEKKQNFGVFLLFSRGENEDGLIRKLSPFTYEYELEVMNKSGESIKHKVTLSEIEMYKAQSFTISDGEDAPWELGFGLDNLLVWPYRDYIINDSMYLRCTIFL